MEVKLLELFHALPLKCAVHDSQQLRRTEGGWRKRLSLYTITHTHTHTQYTQYTYLQLTHNIAEEEVLNDQIHNKEQRSDTGLIVGLHHHIRETAGREAATSRCAPNALSSVLLFLC